MAGNTVRRIARRCGEAVTHMQQEPSGRRNAKGQTANPRTRRPRTRAAPAITSTAPFADNSSSEGAASRQASASSFLKYDIRRRASSGCGYAASSGFGQHTVPRADSSRLAKTTIAIRHSITTSATATSVGGRVRPSALAVLRLMTSSIFVDCCTGKSAGFSPLRIRPA